MFIASIRSAAAAAIVAACVAAGGGAQARMPQASYAAVGAETSVPYGWVDFCGRRPEECNGQRLPAVDVRLTLAGPCPITNVTGADAAAR